MPSTHFGSIWSRHPTTGKPELYGWLFPYENTTLLTPEDLPPALRTQLQDELAVLERTYAFPVEVFIEYDSESQLYQVVFHKAASLSSEAILVALFKMMESKRITLQQFWQQLPLELIEEWYSPRIAADTQLPLIALTQSLTFGAAVGTLVRERAVVEEKVAAKEPFIWLLETVTTEDLPLIPKAAGLILTNQGPTSPVAVLARGLGIPTVSGGEELQESPLIGSIVTLDASSGKVLHGSAPLQQAENTNLVSQLQELAQKRSSITILANANTPEEARRANELGALGIGLCRTEHLFLEKKYQELVQHVLFASHPREEYLSTLVAEQAQDMYDLLSTQVDKRFVVRFLDASISQFLPKTEEEQKRLAQEVRATPDRIAALTQQWQERNPMLGLRGARMLLFKPELLRVQIRSVIQAKQKLRQEDKQLTVGLELPMVLGPQEVKAFTEIIEEEIEEHDKGYRKQYQIGVMIEIPRAAYLIGEIAKLVDFISFGTNDLTQMFTGLSRDDSQKVIDWYIHEGFLPTDPFTSLEQDGVGSLIAQTAEIAKKVNPDLHVNVSGEQAAEPKSLGYLLQCRVDSISCSPQRIPLAWCAAAKYSHL